MNNKNEDDLLIAKIMDKKRSCDTKNKITYSDFLNEREQMIVTKNIRPDNAFFFGGNDNADRKILIFCPDKLNEEIVRKTMDSILSVIRISLPNEKRGEYEHKMYLSAIIKIGIERSKVGDILVFEDGADIITFETNKDYIKQGLSELTRFRKAKISIDSIFNIREKEDNFEETTIIVSSMRCDNIVSEIAGCSRNKACEYIETERVLVNYEVISKPSRMVNINDVITIRGKGKFIVDEIIKNTRNDRLVLKIKRYT